MSAATAAPKAGRRKSRGGHDEEHENHERWLITYADMITLLMVLFIVLFAMGQVDAAKFDKLQSGLGTAFGGEPRPILNGGSGVFEGSGPPAIVAVEAAAGRALKEKEAREAAVEADFDALEGAKDQITKDLAAQGLGDRVRFRHEARGLVVSVVTDAVLFDAGSATLRPEGQAVLDGLAKAVVGLPNSVVIEGHTDDRPIASAVFPSNWELSTGRAGSVLRYLVSAHGLPTSRASSTGYADQRPVADNSTEANRAANRRVEVVLLSQQATASQPPLNPAAPAAEAHS